MLINASHPEENRVAIVVDGILSELDIELAGQQQTKGNIYKAVVVRVEPGLQAAFVDYGAEKHGFLQIGEIHPQLHPEKKSTSKERQRINDILHRGQEILVQVVKGERGTKGAALTTYLSLPGRYMVLMPDSDTKGVSRKIQDDKERKTLKKTMAQLDLPTEMGYIVRTAGIGKEEAELKRDFNYLVSLYKGILARKEKIKAPAQLYQESDIVIRSIRDYFATDMDEVLIDDPQVYQQARDFFSLVMPDQLQLVKQHREKRPIFSRYQIEEQIESLARNQVSLPSGGSIVIDQTEALVAIDVNSGRMAGEKGIEATAARSNIEAAAEIGRQLRLRDLGGLIVIDFIDMRDRKKVREVEQTLWKSVKDDKARVTVGRISQFGLLEMSRQRIRPTLSVGAYLECPHCQGKGRIKSPEAQAVALLRQLHASVSKGQIGTIEAQIPLDVANYLLNEHRQSLSELEKRFDLKIQIYGSLDAIPGQIELELIKRTKTQVEKTAQAPVSHADGLEEALAVANSPAEEPAAETTEESAETETETPTEGTPAKRRRRRRRRRRSGTAGSQQTDEQSSEPAEKQEEEPTGETVAAEITADSSASAAEKPKRRRRRSAAKKTEPSDQTETATGSKETPQQHTAEPSTENVAEGHAETPITATTATEVKPQRRTRRPAVKKVPEAATEGTTEVSAVVEEKPQRRTRRPATKKAPEAATEGTTEVSAEVEEKPQRRTRRPAAKKAPETAAEETTGVSAATEVKPQRRTRRPAAKKVPESGMESTTEVAAVVEEKPKRRTRKPAVKKTPETVTEGTTEASAVVEEKPQRRTRKTPTKKAAKSAVEKPSEGTTAPAEKPKRRSSRSAAIKTEKPGTEVPTEAITPAEEKPKRRPRKPATKKSAD